MICQPFLDVQHCLVAFVLVHQRHNVLCICAAGVQIATKQIDEGIAAGLMAAEAGATWLDLNCGCPIYGTDTDINTFLCLLSLSLLSPEPYSMAVDHIQGLGHTLRFFKIDVHSRLV